MFYERNWSEVHRSTLHNSSQLVVSNKLSDCHTVVVAGGLQDSFVLQV